VSALSESLICRWIACPITTSTMQAKRALSKKGMRSRGFVGRDAVTLITPG
jgi:hypothetical protein